MAGLPTEWIIVHGHDDTVIPYQESEPLTASLKISLPSGHAHVFLLQRLQRSGPHRNTLDGWTLWRTLYALLTANLGMALHDVQQPLPVNPSAHFATVQDRHLVQ